MPSLNVPQRYRPGFEALRTWAENDLARLRIELSAAPPLIDPEKLAREVAGKIESRPRSEVQAVVEALSSLYTYLSHSDATVDETVRDVVQTITAELEPGEQDRFGALLTDLLSLGNLRVAFKAASLALEHDRVFSLAKVITDVRPVFATEIGRPVGTVVIHTLNIHYYQDGEHHEFRVALDANDLQTLRDAVGRAEQKAGSLQELLSNLGVPLYETK